MRKLIARLAGAGLLLGLVVAPAVSFAQTTDAPSSQTAQDARTGQVIFARLQSGQTSCSALNDDDFDHLGDYFVGQTMGASSEAMNTLMEQRMGADNERLMHIAMGKRLSGCDTAAAFPAAGAGFLPMMGWGSSGMMGGGYAPERSNRSAGAPFMMGGAYGSPWLGRSGFGWEHLFGWLLVVIVAVFVIRLLVGRRHGAFRSSGSSALDILKERLAKGEIDAREFEEKKKLL